MKRNVILVYGKQILIITCIWGVFGSHLRHGKVKVKCTLVQALRLCTGCTAHRGSGGIALLFHDHDTRRG